MEGRSGFRSERREVSEEYTSIARLPMVSTPLEAQAVVNAIVHDDRIATLFSDFGPGTGGLPG